MRLKARNVLAGLWREQMEACVKCGACLAFCPLYQLERREERSMRGKIALQQAWEMGINVPAGVVRRALAACTGCQSCRVHCPNAVDTPLTCLLGQLLLPRRGRDGWVWHRRIGETIAWMEAMVRSSPDRIVVADLRRLELLSHLDTLCEGSLEEKAFLGRVTDPCTWLVGHGFSPPRQISRTICLADPAAHWKDRGSTAGPPGSSCWRPELRP